MRKIANPSPVIAFVAIFGFTLFLQAADPPATRPAPQPIRVSGADQWPARRQQLRDAWEQILGRFPAERVALDVRLEAVEEFPQYTRRKVSYAIEEGVREDAVLLVPKSVKSPAPAIVVFHPTSKTYYAQVAGYDTSRPDMMMGPQLAARGYVVLCPRCFIFDDGSDYAGNVAKMKARHPDWLGITRMTWDGIRAVDFLQSLDNVDKDRIGVIGHSLGGKEALYAAAFDSRVRAAVACEGGVGLAMSNWDAAWYLGPKIREPGFEHDHQELLALAAPRAVLVLGGGSADGPQSVPFLEAARPIYRLLGAESNLQFFDHQKGHSYPPTARKVAEAFLDLHLKGAS